MLNFAIFYLDVVSVIEDMNTKDLIRFGRGSCLKPRPVETLLKYRKHKYDIVLHPIHQQWN